MRYNLPNGFMSFSAMTTFQMCPRKYAYQYIDKVEPEGTDTGALDRGSAFHKLVETSGRVDEVTLDETVGGNPYDLAKVKSAFSLYHGMEQEGLLPRMTHREVRLRSEQHQFIGYVDMIGVEPDGRWRLGELKTAGRFDPVKWGTLPVNAQISLYTAFAGEFAHSEFLSMDDMQGVSYRTVVLSAKRPKGPTKKEPHAKESADDFARRIEGDAKVYHQIVAPLPEAIAAAKQGFEYTKAAVHDLKGNSGRAPKHTGNCFAYNRPCQFFQHCHGIKPYSDEQLNLTDDNVLGD